MKQLKSRNKLVTLPLISLGKEFGGVINCFESFSFKNRVSLGTYWFLFYTQIYYQSLMHTPVSLVNINTRNLMPQHFLLHVLATLKSVKWRVYYLPSGIKFVEMLFIAMITKNTTILMRWIRFYFEKTNLKKHKRLFLFLKLILSRLIWNYNNYFSLRGVHLSLRGKFARTGSVRKSRRYIICGKVSRTSKNIAIYSKKTTIRTLTGVMGLKLSLFFMKCLLHYAYYIYFFTY